MKNLTVYCPYCGEKVPSDIESLSWSKDVAEILTVPILERVGRMATTTSWVSKKKDPRLFGLASVWNNTIGLLRGYHLDVNVMKREFRCVSPACNAPFDCYANLDPQHTFSDFWPHLTGKVDATGRFTGSGAKSFAEKIASLGSVFGINPNAFIIVMALIFWAVSLLAYWPFDFQQADFLGQAVLRGCAALLVAIMIRVIKLTSEHIRGSFESLRDLLIVPNPNSLQFWLNFTLGRVTGVSFPNQKGKRNYPQSTSLLRRIFADTTMPQAALVGGLPSLLIAIVLWRSNYLPTTSEITLGLIMELVFWLVIIYFTGVTAWIGFNIGVFCLQNIAAIPMKLTPINGFSNLAPLKRLVKLSLLLVIPVALLPLLFVIALLALPAMQDLTQLWLIPWIQLMLGICLIMIGMGDTGVLVLGLFYVVMITVLSNIVGTSETRLILRANEWVSLGVFGMFLSILLGYHLRRASGPLTRIVNAKKAETVNRMNRILMSLSDELTQIDDNLSNQGALDASRRDVILRDIKAAIELRDKVTSTRVDIWDIRVGFGVLSPFLSSIVLPWVLDYLINQLSLLP